MTGFFNWLRDTIAGAFLWVFDLVKAAVLTVFGMLKDLFLWVFETVLDLVVFIVGGLSFDFQQFDAQQYVGELGAEILNILGLIGIGSALSIIMAAVVIRLTLQLIPFTRLGS